MSRSILRFVCGSLVVSVVTLAVVACSDGSGGSSGAPGPVASGTTSSGGIDTPDRNVICPIDGGGQKCTDGGPDGGD